MDYRSLPDLLYRQAEKYGDRPRYRFKRGGAWFDLSWRAAAEEARVVASALVEWGIRPKQAVALLSLSRVEWAHLDFGIQSAGGVTIPIYPNETADRALYILKDSDAQILFLENLAQFQKMSKVRGELKAVRKIVLIEGTPPVGDPGVTTYEECVRLGRSTLSKNEGEVRRRLDALQSDDLATIVYTSGTTGTPKGVTQTHKNHLSMCANILSMSDISDRDSDLLFLPLAHSFARCELYASTMNGFTTSFAESIDKVMENIREVRPTEFYSVPRLYEKAYAAILSGVESGPPLKRKIFHWAVDVGRRVSRAVQNGTAPGLALGLQAAVADRLVFRKVREAFGGRIRHCVTGASPISKEILEFFHACGIQILEGYGLTETCPAVTLNRYNKFRFGTVGPAIPQCEIKIAEEDGEILLKGPNITRGYYKLPDENRASFTEDGWFRSGDIGVVDADGFLRITDRKKDLIKTAGGKYVAPQMMENMLKTDPVVSQVVVIGDKRPYCVALLTVNPDEAKKLIVSKGGSLKEGEEVASHPILRERIEKTVAEKNALVGSWETIKKFVVLPKELSVEGGELTPTLKVKRKVVGEKYKDAIEGMYR